MSDGQLRVRIRAHEREQTWQPAYIAHELAGTIQAEQHHRHTAAIRAAAAEAASATDPAEHARLRAEAEQTTALADALAAQRDQLTHADHARATWYAHTAETRAAADRARAELAHRDVEADQLDDATSADEWLIANTDANQSEDPHRTVTDETELADLDADRRADTEIFADRAADGAEPAPADIRNQTTETTAADTSSAEDWTTVPTAAATAVAVSRAQRALSEIEHRHQAETRHARDQARHADLTRWHTDDQAADEATHDRDRTPRLQAATPLD